MIEKRYSRSQSHFFELAASNVAEQEVRDQASDEVMAKRCSHYSSSGNWPSNCNNGSTTITCNSTFATAFGCPGGSSDSSGTVKGQPGCRLDKTLLQLCTSYSTSQEAHWATALGNANKLAVPAMGAAFPYSQGQVVGHYQDVAQRSSAYSFYTTYCENYP